MAYELKQPIEEVATSGPGLMFIAYPEAIAKMPLPHLWAVLFFIMLITVGLDTQFCMFETLSSGIVDAFPEKLSNRKTLVTAALSAAMFLLGLPFTTNAGIYIYQLIDWYSSSICMCLGGSLEFVAVAWYYGAERFSRDMEMMLGYSAPILLRICWCIISPTVFFVIFLVILKQYQPVTYLGYAYPEYVVIIGIFISLIPVAPLPVGMVMAYLGTSGTFFERLRKLSMPENWGPGEKKYQEIYATMEPPKAHSLLEYITMNLFGRWSGKRYTLRMELSEPNVVVAYS